MVGRKSISGVKNTRLTEITILGLLLIIPTSAVPVEEELTLSQAENDALIKFKEIALHQIPADMEWMKEDLVLVRYLRGAELDLQDAEEKLIETVKWRRRENMGNILAEDFSDVFEKLPYYVDTKDKEGRPIISISLGDWNIPSLVGNPRRIYRYLDAGLESLRVQIEKSQKQGENVTQAVVLMNIKNFHLLFKEGCHECLSVIFEYFNYQSYYRFMYHKFILINTPVTFEILMRGLRLIMAAETKAALEIYGTEKRRWKKYLLTIIDSDQLYQEFGGTKFH